MQANDEMYQKIMKHLEKTLILICPVLSKIVL